MAKCNLCDNSGWTLPKSDLHTSFSDITKWRFTQLVVPVMIARAACPIENHWVSSFCATLPAGNDVPVNVYVLNRTGRLINIRSELNEFPVGNLTLRAGSWMQLFRNRSLIWRSPFSFSCLIFFLIQTYRKYQLYCHVFFLVLITNWWLDFEVNRKNRSKILSETNPKISGSETKRDRNIVYIGFMKNLDKNKKWMLNGRFYVAKWCMYTS